MSFYRPTIHELSIIEQIEAACFDLSMTYPERLTLIRRLWSDLEKEHGCTVLNITSPEGDIILRPELSS